MRNAAKMLHLMTVLLLVPARARAQQAAADALFDSARTNMAKGAFSEACSQFRASDKLDPAVGTELNLADCEEKRGQLASAWELFRTAEEKLPENDERLPMAHMRAQALQRRVPKLTFRLADGAPKNSALHDADVELGSAAFGVALPMNPGAHELVVSAPGFEPRTFQVQLKEGDTASITVGPGAPVPEPAAASSPVVARRTRPIDEQRRGSSTRTLGFVLAGVGVTGVSVGGVAGLLMLSQKHTVNDECHPDKSCSSAGLNAARSARALQMVSNVGWVVGAVTFGAGAYFIWSAAPSSQPSTTLALVGAVAGGQVSLSRAW